MTSFVQKPENDFKGFINLYYDECRKRFPKMEAIAGKWRFEDLIPGLSDFDTRFICSNDMKADDWCEMSTIVGEVHLGICNKNKRWIRILEHLPGVNITWDELTEEFSYYPEYRQWSFYDTSEPDKLREAERYFSKKVWTTRDEYFYLKKFIGYYAPYNSSLDPLVNLGVYENKYYLHSRIMHYFVPSIQAAISIILKRPMPGKLDTLRVAKEMFTKESLFDELLDIIDQHYEIEKLYNESESYFFDKRLFDVLTLVKNELRNCVTILPDKLGKNIDEWKKQISKLRVSPYLKVSDYTRFWRLMKGRFYFYSNAPSYFDSVPLIINELGRLGSWFYRIPFTEYWNLVTGDKISEPDSIVRELVPDVLTSKEADATLEFSNLFFNVKKKGNEKEISNKLIYIFDDFTKGLDKIICLLRKHAFTEEAYSDIGA